ncbi:MAG TPA: metallophosphoesterase family protein [Polyangiaceae bacterium]|nr:metallophosphoesterase family protein [Polyangiaceae bacterium]
MKKARGGAPAPAPARARVALRPDRGVRLAVVADTHGAPHPEALRLIAELGPDAIVHGGDVGDLAVLDALGAIAPTYAVRGNIDTRAPNLPDVLAIDLADGDERLLRILLLHIAVYGPKLRAETLRLVKENAADLVICGHSHVPFIGRDRGVPMFNPGSIGPRRPGLPVVFGVFELANNAARMHHVDCETGRRWEP